MSYDEEDEQDVNYPSCKVVLLGEAGVGKTSIISSFITRKFDQNILSTTGASFAAKNLVISSNKQIKFEIWDTAGQEKFRSLTKLFYKDASIVILVYDITRQDSFDELVNYWYRQVKDTITSNLIFAVCANKSDLYETEDVNEETARVFAQDINAIFKTTSAKNTNGIDDLFTSLGEAYFNPKTNSAPKKEDKSKKKNVIKLKKEEQYIDREDNADKSRCC